jgi:hypothetical protein
MTAPSITLAQNVIRVGLSELKNGGKVNVTLTIDEYDIHETELLTLF